VVVTLATLVVVVLAGAAPELLVLDLPELPQAARPSASNATPRAVPRCGRLGLVGRRDRSAGPPLLNFISSNDIAARSRCSVMAPRCDIYVSGGHLSTAGGGHTLESAGS
jgi:hypothetical protein